MHLKFKHPATIKGLGPIAPKQIIALAPAVALPLIASGTATSIKFSACVPPDTDEEMEKRRERAKELGQDADWDRRPPPKRQRAGFVTTFQAEETFGERFKRAVEQRTAPRRDAAKREKERLEKERKRYRPPPPWRRK